ncbi:uncharacterized protein LOC128217708 isoform X2 [Mya arenaria]|uniref:uncharacterized protein LOC128217708 isoform X2 n=1 Tax=Mya arenaria TaxID=6604 RepID=UPI0022E08AE4|nr:uncharacterized protein LOC128217708 isoform X2 [Mya arenaria]
MSYLGEKKRKLSKAIASNDFEMHATNPQKETSVRKLSGRSETSGFMDGDRKTDLKEPGTVASPIMPFLKEVTFNLDIGNDIDVKITPAKSVKPVSADVSSPETRSSADLASKRPRGYIRSGRSSAVPHVQKLNVRTVAKIIKVGVGAKHRMDNKKQRRSYPEAHHDGHRQSDFSHSARGRRSTFGDVMRDSRRLSNSVASWRGAGRRSIGSNHKEAERLRDSSSLLNMAVREEVQRRHLMEKWQFAGRFSLLLRRWLSRHSVLEVSQMHPFYQQFQLIKDSGGDHTPAAAGEFEASYFKANKQRKMSQEAVRVLTMFPEQRTKEEVHYAMIALRGIDCIADYPLRMQEALARHGMFQSFGSKRIIVKQGHAPVYFYFILYGTVVVATLEMGEPYAKTRVILRRGENFGELSIAHRTNRQSTVITMEYTEFLTIDCDTYENIFMSGGVKTINDPDHNNFMRSLFFLKHWPLEILRDNPKAMKFCYFSRKKLMVKDSNMSEWIYIVKSGSLRVYKKLQKCYPHVNHRTGNHRVRAHVDGYRCFMSQESEYHRYAMYNNVSLPPPLAPDSDSEDEEHHLFKFKGNAEEKENLLALPLMQRVERLIRPRTAEGGVLATYGQSRHGRSSGDRPKTSVHNANGRSPLRPTQLKLPSSRTTSSTSNTTSDLAVDLSSATADGGDGTDGADGRRTLLDDFEGSSRRKKKEVTAADLDPEFVLIQTLTKGQAFGIQQLLTDNQPSLALVSGGAECIMINKRFFKDNCDPNVLQALRQQVSPYPSDEDLQRSLQTRVDWLRYRKVTLCNLMAEHTSYRPARAKSAGRNLVLK